MTENTDRDPIQEVLDDLARYTERVRQKVEDAHELAEKTARDLAEDQMHELLGTNRGAERVYRLAEENGVSVEAAARYLSPKPVGAPRSAHDLDEGVASDYATWGFSSGEVADLAREKGITKTEAASILARQTKPRREA